MSKTQRNVPTERRIELTKSVRRQLRGAKKQEYVQQTLFTFSPKQNEWKIHAPRYGMN